MLDNLLHLLQPDKIIIGDLFPENIHIIIAKRFGESIQIIGRGGDTDQTYNRIVAPNQFEQIQFLEQSTFTGDPHKFGLAVEAHRLGLAFEYDPYYSLSITRIDPLPHQLEAVYDYFLKMPRIRFLLADDAGAGKTIMAGLLIKELKARGLADRILIVAPANLTYQWQREMKEKFRENFDLIRGDVLRATYGSNPWQEKNQVVTSVSWAAIQEDANQSLLQVTWDLVIVDEAHKMSAKYDNKTYAYELGEALSTRTDHFLLMTATPHSGDTEKFRRFLQLLDADVYADKLSLTEAMKKNEAPFYLRRVKEAMVSFPDPLTGVVKSLFTKRIVQTIELEITDDEIVLYDKLTKYTQEHSSLARDDGSGYGQAVLFSMAMLQRRFSSSLYAVRRSLERMMKHREQVLGDPDQYWKQQLANRLPKNIDDLPEEERLMLSEKAERYVLKSHPATIKADIKALGGLIDQARTLESLEVETKIKKLQKLLQQYEFFSNPNMKLLIFTEHKETLDYLAGDGKDDRPLGKLIEWGLSTVQIHGGMKTGDRNTPGTRLYAEREFRERAQIMVATEAAGEGINLQFCWLMVNYDIPWNPSRLEQRMGRIHRYGQEKDCRILNFVITNTTEGRVMSAVFERVDAIEREIDPNRTGKVFSVLGNIFPDHLVEKALQDMSVQGYESEDFILERMMTGADTNRFRQLTNSALEGLAKRELNLSAILGRSAEAKEKRLVGEVVEDFFVKAAPFHGVLLKKVKQVEGVFTIGKVPSVLWKPGEVNERRFGVLGREYKALAFAKSIVATDSTLDWLTPGHPLFEVVREETIAQFTPDLQKGAFFYDIHALEPLQLTLFSAAIVDGMGHRLHQRLFVLASDLNGTITLRQPTVFLDLIPATDNLAQPTSGNLPTQNQLKEYLNRFITHEYLTKIQTERQHETNTVERHLQLSLNALINKQSQRLVDLQEHEMAPLPLHLSGLKSQTETRLQGLRYRLNTRQGELAKQRQCSVSGLQQLAIAWVLPHPDRNKPDMLPFVGDPSMQQIAVKTTIANEEAQGYLVEQVETDSRGFTLISRRPNPTDPTITLDLKFITVRGQAEVGQVALSTYEYRTAQRLTTDYYLYVVFSCASTPTLHIKRNPATLDWQAMSEIQQFFIEPSQIVPQQ